MNHKSHTTPVLYHVRESPDISHADGRSDAGKDKSSPAFESITFFFMFSHVCFPPVKARILLYTNVLMYYSIFVERKEVNH